MFLCCCFCLLAFSVFAQSAQKFEEILQSSELTCGQASYLPAVWLDSSYTEKSYAEAFDFLVQQGIFLQEQESSVPITLAQLAGICMRTWELSGGMFYKITKSDRYAFKELKVKGFLSEIDDPSMTVSGSKAINIIYKCMEMSESGVAK